MANVGVTSAQDGVLTQHPVVVPEMNSFEDVRQAIANVFATFQQSLHAQFPLTNFQGKRITNVAPPTAADDVVTLKYLQSNQPSQQNKTINPFSPNVGSGGSNLWTQAGAALYPTATFTTFVLVGAQNTDLSIGAGTVVANAGTGSGFVVITGQTNASVFQMTVFGGLCSLLTNKTGTGTVLPMTFGLGGLEAARFTTGLAFFVGITSSDFFTGSQPGTIVGTNACGVLTGATNANLLYFHIDAGTRGRITNAVSGTATLLPFTILFGSTEVTRFRTGGSVLFGLTSSDVGDNLGWIVEQGVFGIVNAATNANALFLSVNGTTETVVHSSFSGAGASLPLSLYVNGTRVATCTTAFNFFVGALSITLPSSFFVGAGQNIWATDSIGVSTSSGANTNVIFMSTSPTEVVLAEHITGTNSHIPMSFYNNGSRRVSIDTSGALLVGLGPTTAIPAAGRVVATLDFIVVSGATSNESFGRLFMVGGSDVRIESSQFGSGTNLPMTFFVAGSERSRITTGGVFLFGLTSTDLSVGSGTVVTNSGSGSGFIVVNATTNATVFEMTVFSSLCQFIVNKTGTGSTQPITFNFAGTEVVRIQTNGEVLIGLTSSDASSNAGNLYISNFFGILSATTNAHALFMSINGATETVIHSSFSGTGTALPLSLYVSGNRRATIDTTGSLLVGLLSSDLSAAGAVISNTEVAVVTAATNASVVRLLFSGSLAILQSTVTGTGTGVALAFFVSGEAARIATSNTVLIGLTSTDASASTGNLYISNFFGILSATTNAHALFMSINGTTETVIHSSFSGAGTTLPLSLYTNGTRRLTIDTAGSIIAGSLTSDFTNGSIRFIMVAGYYALMSAATNASGWYSVVNGTTELQFVSTHTGTGTTLPISFYWVSGATILLPLQISQNGGTGRVYVNRSNDDGSGAVLQVAGNISVNGTVLTVP